MRVERIHFHEVDSTNTWAKERMDVLPRDALSIVTADYQTAGRGRFKRVWHSSKGSNLLATYCFFLELDRQGIGNIPQVLALVAAKTFSTVSIRIKWPNDLLLKGKKMGGLLCETVSFEDAVGVCLGIGINLNMTAEEAASIDVPATSYLIEMGSKIDVETVVQALSANFLKAFRQFLIEGFAPFLEDYRGLLQIHNPVVVKDGNRTLSGQFVEVDSAGALVLQLEDGSLQTISSGEIIHT